ncbi:MAG: LysR family transcriptional regulator [Xanthomonadaceae bacterium]|jgi:DNA-binding transcriptional LysR family regulator|nr:LysR family transcriptional regulator [Xanthomonadaceae bacterium]
MTLEQLRFLVRVVQAGSFTRAAEVLGTRKSHVSRVIAQLETDLGAKLIERTTRRLGTTEVGREVFERALAILGAVEDTELAVQQAQAAPRGVLRLTCGVEFGELAVGGWVREYLAAFPEAAVDAEYTARVVDLSHEGFDLAIRIGPLAESRLVARRLGALDYGLFACPRYLAAHPAPQMPVQLEQHALVMFSAGAHRRGWVLAGPDGGEVRIEGPARWRVNHGFAVRDALLDSLGIGLLPLLLAADAVRDGRLVPVLPAWRPAPADVHAVYLGNRFLSPKVRAFVEIAQRRFPEAVAGAEDAVRACLPR